MPSNSFNHARVESIVHLPYNYSFYYCNDQEKTMHMTLECIYTSLMKIINYIMVNDGIEFMLIDNNDVITLTLLREQSQVDHTINLSNIPFVYPLCKTIFILFLYIICSSKLDYWHLMVQGSLVTNN